MKQNRENVLPSRDFHLIFQQSHPDWFTISLLTSTKIMPFRFVIISFRLTSQCFRHNTIKFSTEIHRILKPSDLGSMVQFGLFWARLAIRCSAHVRAEPGRDACLAFVSAIIFIRILCLLGMYYVTPVSVIKSCVAHFVRDKWRKFGHSSSYFDVI